MDTATRTTEGYPDICPVCGKRMSVNPSDPFGDAVCPHCGVLIYSELSSGDLVPDDLRQLSRLGVQVETDDQGEITRVQFNGPKYDDRTILQIAKLKDVPVIDIRNTGITAQGADRLRALLPDAIIER